MRLVGSTGGSLGGGGVASRVTVSEWKGVDRPPRVPSECSPFATLNHFQIPVMRTNSLFKGLSLACLSVCACVCGRVELACLKTGGGEWD